MVDIVSSLCAPLRSVTHGIGAFPARANPARDGDLMISDDFGEVTGNEAGGNNRERRWSSPLTAPLGKMTPAGDLPREGRRSDPRGQI